MCKILLSQPDITDLERKAVQEVLETTILSLGPKVEEFEKKIAEYVGRKYAIAVNNGTSALHLIIRALDIRDNDEVITTPFSFISSSNCILYERAKPVFVDIDPQSLNINTSKIEKKITKKTKAILAVDVFGYPADWNELTRIVKKYNLYLIEDSAEALGSEYLSPHQNFGGGGKGKKCGSFGNAAIFSFFPNKQITTAGEGGVVLTDNKEISDFCYSVRNQGRRQDNNKWLEHIRLGYNYRMPEVCAAMGIVQLQRIEEVLKKRAKVASLYNEKLKDFEEIELPNNMSSWFVYVIRLNEKYEQEDRDRIIREMRERGIECSNYFYPIHLQPYYKKRFGFKQGDFPNCEYVSERTIALPFYNNLQEEQIDYIVETLKKIIKQ